MSGSMMGFACTLALLAPLTTAAQLRPDLPPFGLKGCLHERVENDTERQRRTDALGAVRLINAVLARFRAPADYPSWEMLADSPVVAALRGRDVIGPGGALARKMVWGSDEPLPDWHIHYVAARDAYAFKLTDMRDPCYFSYASDDTGVIVEGYPVGETNRVVPLGS